MKKITGPCVCTLDGETLVDLKDGQECVYPDDRVRVDYDTIKDAINEGRQENILPPKHPPRSVVPLR